MAKNSKVIPLLLGLAVVVLLCVVALILAIIVLVRVNDHNSNTSTEMPPTTMPPTQNPEGNVNPPPVGTSDAYKSAAKYLMDSMDKTVNPCQDFYQYACGTYAKKNVSDDTVNQIISFGNIDNDVVTELTDVLEKLSDNAEALKKTKSVYDMCKATSIQYQINDYDKFQKEVVDKLMGWPILSTSTDASKFSLEMVQSYLSSMKGVDTFMGQFVDTKWSDPTQGYMLHVDQPPLTVPLPYWRLAEDDIKTSLIGQITKTATKLAAGFKMAAPDAEMLKTHATEVAELENKLQKVSKTSAERRIYKDQYNPMTISALQKRYPLINWQKYVSNLFSLAGVTAAVDGNTILNIAEPKVMEDVMTIINSYLVNNKLYVIQNYVVFRYMLNEVDFFPTPKQSKEYEPTAFPELRLFKKPRGTIIDAIETREATMNRRCANYVRNMLPWQAGYLYVTNHFKNNMDTVRDDVKKMITAVLKGFESMLDILTWMTPATLDKARDKVAGVRQNPLYPDWIMDPTKLAADIAGLTLPTSDDFYMLQQTIQTFRTKSAYQVLNKQTYDRLDFSSSPAIVNAWYIPEYNSITFPAAILNEPFYHPDYPLAIKYGGMGVVMGHELTHGFDDQGVQWGPMGKLESWIDADSTKGFDKMASCVIGEYSQWCPRTSAPCCVIGAQTQGENIADNGGIRAAFHAYQSAQNVYGPEPRLPGMESYTLDKVFFLGFAQVWCRAVTDNRLRAQLLTDVHSPAEARVNQAVRNFPAFAKAFNCKVNDPMYPPVDPAAATNKWPRCNVWVEENTFDYTFTPKQCPAA